MCVFEVTANPWVTVGIVLSGIAAFVSVMHMTWSMLTKPKN